MHLINRLDTLRYISSPTRSRTLGRPRLPAGIAQLSRDVRQKQSGGGVAAWLSDAGVGEVGIQGASSCDSAKVSRMDGGEDRRTRQCRDTLPLQLRRTPCI